jgi:hypothetical protein
MKQAETLVQDAIFDKNLNGDRPFPGGSYPDRKNPPKPFTSWVAYYDSFRPKKESDVSPSR